MAEPRTDPVPFELLSEGGRRIATDGHVTLQLLDDVAEAGRVFRRRGLRGVALGSAGAQVLPELNRLAGDLVAQLDMPSEQLQQRLQQLLALAAPAAPQPVEWAVAEVEGLRVYVDGGANILITRRDLTP